MPKLVTLSCDSCGIEQSARHFVRLWDNLRKQGWNKGLRDTYFCPKAQCQEQRAVLLRDAEGGK